jgi:nitroimidazol reductase NimA-like FMN-containing flavoprotein (pyridoxamine 5'-phosphate oxidase superfamily)
MSSKMTRAEAEAFLAEVRVGVLSINEPGRGALTVPLWYAYEVGGELWFVTEKDSRKGKLLADGQRMSLCVQDETAPYRYVSVEGPIVSITTANTEEHMRPMARRYLGVEGGDRYIEAEPEDPDDPQGLLVRVKPERWLSADYSKVEIGL